MKDPGTVALISCSKSKGERRAPAAELYTSYVFRKSVEYATRVLGIKEWAILSAKHGLVMPDRVTAPYDLTLSKMKPAARRAWAARVQKQIRAAYPEGTHFVVLAGEFYLAGVPKEGYSYSLPLKGMGTGVRRSFLGKATRA